MSIAKAVEVLSRSFSRADAIKTVTPGEDAFVNGKSFTHADYTLGVGESEIINYLLDPTGCTCDHVVAENPIFNATAGPVTVEYFVGTTVSANGTELVTFNRRSGGDAAKSKLYVAPTITGDGVRIAGQLVTATSAVQGDTGATTSTGLPFEVDKGLLLLIRVTNTNGADVAIGRTFSWIEE
jgi:hypothetical protein